MKELLLQYAEYNVWANKQIITAMLALDDIAVDKVLVSSFPSIRSTVYHVMGAEFIWLQRLELVEHPIWLPVTFQGSFMEACGEWLRSSSELSQFVNAQQDDNSLTHRCEYNDRKGVPAKFPVSQILLHVFNHSSYHRGQLITMLRQVGATEIPGTDFIGFVKQE